MRIVLLCVLLFFFAIFALSVDCFFFFFTDTATHEIYTYRHTLSLHDALPICHRPAATLREQGPCRHARAGVPPLAAASLRPSVLRSKDTRWTHEVCLPGPGNRSRERHLRPRR